MQILVAHIKKTDKGLYHDIGSGEIVEPGVSQEAWLRELEG